MKIKDYSFCFDLDGTLIDTAPDLIRVLNYVIGLEGLNAVNFTRARNQVGYGSRRLIEIGYEENERDLPRETLDRLQKEFLETYADTIDQESRPFPGVVDTLTRLKHDGAELNICTNKPGYLARPLIEKLGLKPLFKRIIGSDDGPAKKPDARHIFCAAGHSQADRIIMVGDSLPDYRAARNAGVICVMVNYGYTPVPIAGMAGDITLSHFRDLPVKLNSYLR